MLALPQLASPSAASAASASASCELRVLPARLRACEERVWCSRPAAYTPSRSITNTSGSFFGIFAEPLEP